MISTSQPEAGYEALVALAHQNITPAPQLVLDELRRTGELDRPTACWLTSVATAGAPPETARRYAATLVSETLRRKVESWGLTLIAAAETAAEDELKTLIDTSLQQRHSPDWPRCAAMPMTDAEVFWSARPVLRHILTLARSRRVGPWAVLGTAMARAVATIPPHVALPGTVGGRMSLNLFVALVGPSGAGKGGADAAAAGLKFEGSQTDSLPLGSGEGASRTFRPLGTPPDEPNPVTSVVFTVPEIDTLTALTSRQGSTLSAELRKLYSGEALGFANAGKDTRTLVAAHTYRACVIVGVQPLRSHALLGAADGGLPQRFIWMPTTDPDAPEERPPDPGCWNALELAWPRGHSGHLRLVGSDLAPTGISTHHH
jgi:hypothetical protein